MQISIPFQGFYESIHSYNMDDALEMYYTDENDECNDDAVESFQWDKKLIDDYSKLYIDAFNEYFDGSPFTFVELDSPREYNFTTDRIFCEVSSEFITKMYSETETETLQKHFTESLTSYDGFCSFYSPDLNDHNIDPLGWETPLLAILLCAYMDHLEINHDEMYIMEDASCNGEFYNLIGDCIARNETE